MPSNKALECETRITEALTYLRDHPNTQVSAVARDFGVSRVTLTRRQKGGLGAIGDHNGGQNKILDDAQEAALVNFIRNQAPAGFGLSPLMILDVVRGSWEKEGLTAPSKRWVKGFMKKYKQELHVITQKPMDGKQIAAQHPKVGTL